VITEKSGEEESLTVTRRQSWDLHTLETSRVNAALISMLPSHIVVSRTRTVTLHPAMGCPGQKCQETAGVSAAERDPTAARLLPRQ
jgi:hypothetical protein